MTETWEKLGADEAIEVLATVNPFIDPVPFNSSTTTIRRQYLGFYDDYVFYELTDLSAIPSARKYALARIKAKEKPDVRVVTWTNQPIYEANERAPIRIDDRNVLDYVKFFFNYVRGRHGRFVIVETVDDIRWQIEPPLQGRKVMQEMLFPVSVASKDEEGAWILDACMIFKDSLFRTKIHVRPDGLVALSDEELKVEGMPVIPDAIVA